MDTKNNLKPKVKRKKKKILGDTSRVITRLHIPDGEHRIRKIIGRIINLSDTEAENLLEQIMLDFSERHKDIKSVFENHQSAIKDYIPQNMVLSQTQRELIGAYFTMEYSIESAALFNPSIIPHPDQSGLAFLIETIRLSSILPAIISKPRMFTYIRFMTDICSN